MAGVLSGGEARATATQLVRDFPDVRRMADLGPVHITSHGRTELVVLNPSQFAQFAGGTSTDTNRLEGKLAIILDTVDTAIAIFDDDLRVTRVNPALCHLVDADEARLIGVHASELASHPSHRYIVERLAEVHRSGYPEVLTATSARDDTRTLQIRLKPWPKGIALFADDITDRMRLGDLVIADERMETALTGLGGVGTAHVQSCGTLLSISQGLAQMAGVWPKSLLGARLQSLFSPKSRTIVNDALLKVSDEPRRYVVDYLRNGVTVAPATISITSYWTAEHHACAAVALYDPNWTAS